MAKALQNSDNINMFDSNEDSSIDECFSELDNSDFKKTNGRN